MDAGASQSAAATTAYTSATNTQTAISVGSGVVVPADFLGFNAHYWPSPAGAADASANPTFAVGFARTHDYYENSPNGFRWEALEPTAPKGTTVADVYATAPTTWAQLDSYIQTLEKAGTAIYFTVYGTPTWAAAPGFSVNVNGTPTAASAPPASQASLALFVQALITRYNKPTSGTAYPIKYIEEWNEPEVRGNSVVTFSGSTITWDFTESSGKNIAGLPVGVGDQVFFTSTGTLPTGLAAGTLYYVTSIENGTPATFSVSATSGGKPITLTGGSGTLSAHEAVRFFWGQGSDIATLGRTVYQAAKAVDPTITVVSPGFTSCYYAGDNEIDSFLKGSDGAGGTGASWVQAVAYHDYDTTIGTANASAQSNITAVIPQIKSMITSGGLKATTPLFISEHGYTSNSGNYYLGQPDKTQATLLERDLIVHACLGVQAEMLYAYDDAFLGTSFLSQSSAKQAAVGQVASGLVGQTITACSTWSNGQVSVTLKNGNSLTL